MFNPYYGYEKEIWINLRFTMRNKLSFNFLCLLLAIIAIIMIYMGISSGIIPPILTGIGFLLIAYLLQNLK